MARLGRLGFLCIAIVFHLTYSFSIFDIYFVSPIVSGMSAYKVDIEAPAKRLVLYVGDGLRADKAFQFFPDPSPDASGQDAEVPRPMAPYLRSRVLEAGTFGVSHTRVPTESRPGHVALIAGLYEDVSAVTTGWKLNPVNFDSVFNRSTHTWSWGSPDILPMFSAGATPGRVTDDTYGAEFEDFSKDAKELDYWVFDHVQEFFEGARHNHTLAEELRQSGNIFFLHLLGLDTTGHSYRPYSQEYLHNIQIVDDGVRKTTQLIDEFFGDGETAYIFTADHGMSDWGSHGDGHPDNTRTPLIAWGAGIAAPIKEPAGQAVGHDDGFSSDWQLDTIQRNDVAQADVAPLMAHLVGIEYPVNSVGELPLPFLSATDEEKAKAMLVNAQEILEMYRVKEEQKKATVIQYRPFDGFAKAGETTSDRIAQIMTLIQEQDYAEAIRASDALIALGLSGLRYLQTYDWLFLRTLVTLGYAGWVAFAFTTAVDVYVVGSKFEAERSTSSLAAFAAVLVALFGYLLVQSSNYTYYIYAIFPIVFWEEVYAHRRALQEARRTLLAQLDKSDVTRLALNLLGYIVMLEIMVQSYYHREIYSIAYVLLAGWPLSYGLNFVKTNRVLVTIWTLSCLSMSIFTVLPAIKIESPVLIQLGGFLILTIGVSFLLFENQLLGILPGLKRSVHDYSISRTVFGLQVGLVALAMAVTWSSVSSLQAKKGLPLGTQLVGWLTLISSFAVPFLHTLQPRKDYLHRLALLFMAFGPLFIILTISYEGLFYLAIGITFLTWVGLEHRIQEHSQHSIYESGTPLSTAATTASDRDAALRTGDYRALTLSDARISLFFLYLLQSAFFSTGNIASVSSFSLDAVYRLLPIFDPFSQGALLLLKLLAPFALLSANLGILTKRLRLQGGSLFAVVMGIGDYLTLRFFWEVRDEGSWLEIGESISMFVIASTMCIFVAGLEALSEVLIRGVQFDNKQTQANCNGVASKSTTQENSSTSR